MIELQSDKMINLMRKSMLQNVIMSFLLFAFVSCQQNNRVNSILVRNTSLLDSTNKSITVIDSNKENPSVKVKQLIQLYLRVPKEVRPAIYKPVFTKLFYLAYAHPDSTVLDFYRQQSVSNTQFPQITIEALLRQAYYDLFINQEAGQGLQSLKKVAAYRSQFDDTMSRSYNSLYAQTMLQMGNLKAAASYYIKTIALAEKIKDSASIISNYGNLAVVYSQMNEDVKAIPLEFKSLDYFTAHKDSVSMFIGNVSLGRAFATIGKVDTSFIFYNNALQLLKAGVHNPSVEIILYSNLGEIYADSGELKRSIYYYDLCKQPLKEIGSDEQYRIFNIYATKAYAQVRDVSKEVDEIKKNILVFVKDSDLINVRASYYSLYEIAGIKKRPAEALKYYILSDSVDKILASNANKKFTDELQTKYETQRREVKIQMQQKELVKKAAFSNMLLALLIVLGLGTAFIITRGRLIRKRKEALMQQQFTSGLLAKTEEERGRIARDLHDGLSQELLLLKNQVNVGVKIEPEKIDKIINEVRTISRNIHPVMLDQIGFKESILHTCNQISESEQLFIATDIEYHMELSKEKELQLFRIIQEALNNIIKYASAQAAKVQIAEIHKGLGVIIQDNGKGFDVQATLNGHSAFGLLSILERSKAINGKASISSDSKGTIINIEIPLSYG
ncbi:ATP-binding protein [Arachidicoccus sp.]|uniref:tetratricopeptide repeat-containing sensor histidine kinase n=1 Tax=Arachidicoccus sp. TaxID=1872624 RepID=UPI003D1AF896